MQLRLGTTGKQGSDPRAERRVITGSVPASGEAAQQGRLGAVRRAIAPRVTRWVFQKSGRVGGKKGHSAVNFREQKALKAEASERNDRREKAGS